TRTIQLAQGGEYVLDSDETYASSSFGWNALPIVSNGSNITILGQGATISAGVVGLRMLAVDQGTLALHNLTLKNATLGSDISAGGAGIINVGGTLTLDRVTMENNKVQGQTRSGRGMGGAIYTYFGTTTITN